MIRSCDKRARRRDEMDRRTRRDAQKSLMLVALGVRPFVRSRRRHRSVWQSIFVSRSAKAVSLVRAQLSKLDAFAGAVKRPKEQQTQICSTASRSSSTSLSKGLVRCQGDPSIRSRARLVDHHALQTASSAARAQRVPGDGSRIDRSRRVSPARETRVRLVVQ